MNMHWVDWSIVAVLFSFVTVMAIVTRRYTRSVADFLAAGRSAGRYVITVSEGAAALGAITVVATYEKYYNTGFTAQWWDCPVLLIGIFVALLGWVVYRFRRTRAMTMAQFFEMRYGRRFRIFAGLLAFVSGLLNFGIFPAVGSRFFMYFCGLPEQVQVAGLSLSTFALLMLFLLGVSLSFTLLGGQIAVIVTDFIQGLFCMAAFLVIFAVLAGSFSWTQVSEAVAMAPPDASLVHPLHTTSTDGFDIYYFLIAMFGAFYMTRAWQGASGYNSSARNPHEARMGYVLGQWRTMLLYMLIMPMPICAYTFLHHPDFATQAAAVQEVIGGINGEQLQKQLTVPVALSGMLPVGVMGLLCAVMLAAFVSTHDTYLHSWGSIFIQDVVLPFRKKRLSRVQHLRLLRWSICGVAVFIFCFSLLFPQTDYILMFFAITGAIYLGGAGSVIVGGLYWKRGTTAGAFAAMSVGAVLAVAGIVFQQPLKNAGLSLSGQELFLVAAVCAIVSYIVVSLLAAPPKVDMDRLLRRGRYAVPDDATTTTEPDRRTGWAVLRMGPEFSRTDKVIYLGFVAWIAGWTTAIVGGTAYNLIVDVAESSWLEFWRYYVVMAFVLGVVTVVWFTIGGVRDMRDMFRRLRTAERDDSDDGTVLPGDED